MIQRFVSRAMDMASSSSLVMFCCPSVSKTGWDLMMMMAMMSKISTLRVFLAIIKKRVFWFSS